MNREKNEIIDLVQQVDVTEEDTYIYLSNESLDKFKELFLEWKHKELFQQHKLEPRNKILLHGRSGNGKTTLAKFLARKFNLPFVQVKHEQILSSYLGETTKYVAMVFDQIKEDCILFWDELDSFTMKRGRDRNSTEYDKALNVMLIKMERLSTNVIFVGATNLKEEMDTAILRRFDIVHELPAPSAKDKEAFAKRHINHYNIAITSDELSAILDGNSSFSDIKRDLISHLRKQILSSIK